MQNFKDKLYHYESLPPEGIWEQIALKLDEKETIQLKKGRGKSKYILYGATAAAAALIIIFISSVFFKTNTTEKYPSENAVVKSNNFFSTGVKDSINLNYQLLEKIINTPQNRKLIASNNVISNGFTKTYLTVAGPEGQPIKISPKAATLIVSADNDYPPKPVWSEQIDKWQQIMLSNTKSPTSGLLDIMQMATNLE